MHWRAAVTALHTAFFLKFIQKCRNIVARRFQIKASTRKEPHRRTLCTLCQTLDALDRHIDVSFRHRGFYGVGKGFRATLRARWLITVKTPVDADQQGCDGRFGRVCIIHVF